MKTKIIVTLLLLAVFLSAHAQSFNQEVIPEEGKPPYLLGKINKEGLSAENYASWFNKNYDEYQTDEASIDTLQRHLDKYTIKAFMGTWCGDSKRETPRLYKVLDAAQFPLDRLTLVAVGRNKEMYKQSPGGEHESLNIHRVPTFIIYKNGREVNRIVESPVESLEADLVKIIQKEEYVPNYHGVTLVNDMLTEMDLERFNKKQRKLLPKLKEIVKKPWELNTYSSVLFYAHRKDEAIVVARLNTLLFPEEPRIFASLASKLKATGNTQGAMENYKTALTMDPDNEDYKTALNELAVNKEGTH